MQTLITPKQAVALAFSDGEQAPAGAVTDSDLAAAEARYIVPVIGKSLHEKLLAGAYPELLAGYVAPAAALFARVVAQPRLGISTLPGGLAAPRSDGYQPAAEAAVRRLQRMLRGKARTLLRRAAAHIAAYSDDYPEYDAEQDIFNRCRIDGDLIQIP